MFEELFENYLFIKVSKCINKFLFIERFKIKLYFII